MKLRIILPLLAVALISLASCEKQDISDVDTSEAHPWQFVMTRAGATHTDEVRTYRASLLHNGTGELQSDGTYSGYYTENHWTETNGAAWPYSTGWLYPCRTNHYGDALDTDGNIIPWDATDWFSRTDKDSQWALRGPNTSNDEYALVITSPAQRMVGYRTPEMDPIPEGMAHYARYYHWGFLLDRKASRWAVSPVVGGLSVASDYISGNYIYTFAPKLLEHRAMLTVKVACGALDEANISKVHFQNVISKTYYRPPRGNEGATSSRTGNYEMPIIDGNDNGDDSYDPLVSYYLDNSYPSTDGEAPGTGDKFIAPDGSPAHIVRRSGQTTDFIPNDEWQYFTSSDEWTRGSTDKYVLTAIKDFPILPLDYSTPEGDSYFYRDIMPQVVVYSGVNGDIKSTILVDANLEPMKKYTMYIYVSSVYIHAVLTVSDWTIFQFWPDNDDVLDVSFGNVPERLVGELTVSDWRPVDTDPDHGVIED